MQALSFSLFTPFVLALSLVTHFDDGLPAEYTWHRHGLHQQLGRVAFRCFG
jgi:lipopolysaccharide/colanic/teichoic acid biosynthesis glycosyltransferase